MQAPISGAFAGATFGLNDRNEARGVRVQGERRIDPMADQTAELPEGTDKVIEGAATPAVAEPQVIPAGGNSGQGLAGRFRSGSEQLASQAGERARGIVTQGLERTAEALANVSKMVGDTASGIEERLGPEYGDYARRAAGAIENAANTIAAKDPDELIEVTRNFVRESPGIALAGAAVVGFVVARLLKTGKARNEEDDDS
jgi:ElaB/YqjD/DUF883 family membrane-anchored ribosome-binding protein